MSIDSIGAIHLKPTFTALESVPKPASGFTDLLTDAISDTNNHLVAADTALQQLARGEATSLHQTMLTLDEAKLSFQFLEQVRNRLMSAYQDILREQI